MQTRKFWTLAALLLLALALRLYHLQTQSIWFDEGWSAYAAAQPTLWDAFQADATNPPLYYGLLNISARYTGVSEFALRWFSLAFGLLVIPLAYQLGRVLFDERAGLYAAFLTSVSPPLWWASQEARMYTLLAVLVCVAALSWHIVGLPRAKPMRKSSLKWWLALWCAELALLYSHNSAPVIVLWLNGMTLLAWILRRSLRIPDWRLWFAGQILVGVLWSPYFFSRFLDVQQANSSLVRRPEIGLPLFSQIVQSFWTGTWSLVDKEPLLLLLCVVVSLLYLVLINWRKPNARWMVGHTVVLVAALIFGLSVLGNELHGRYLVMIVPLLLIPLGDGLAHLLYPVQRYALSALFIVLLAINIHFITQDKAYQHDDARAMVQHYADTLDADDTVLAWSYADRYELAYYWERLGVRALRVTLPEGTDLDVVLPLLPQNGGDVALNIWYTQRADFRGMLRCMLGNGTVNVPEEFSVFGMSNQLFRAPQLTLPQLRSFDVSIGTNGTAIAQVTEVGDFLQFTPDQALCLPIQLTLTQTVDVDLKAAVRVYNDLGWEVASDDVVFADESQRLSAEAAAGSTLTAYPLLRLPFGVPAGEYRVELTIYDERVSPSGYDVLSEAGHSLALGTWTTRLGADWSAVRRADAFIESEFVPVSDDLTLLAHSKAVSVRNGDFMRVSLLWQGTDALPELTLAAQDDSWEVDLRSNISDHDAITLDWREVQVPLDAGTGAAELRLPDGTAIMTVSVEALPAQYTEPSVDNPIGVRLDGTATLIGYTLDSDGIDHTQPLPITLVWQAENVAHPYVVFVQLIDANGQVIAQSDSVPSQGARPTTGWRAGEYITDEHVLQFNDSVTVGTATLIAGMYDADTFERVEIAPGVNAITLATNVEVR